MTWARRVFWGAGLFTCIMLTGAVLVLTLAGRNLPSVLTPPALDKGTYVFRNVQIVPMTGVADVIEKGSVVVVDDRIVAVGNTDDIKDPQDAVVIDGAGQTLLPGLIDMHIHIFDEVDFAAYLSHGVTTVRNMGGLPFHLALGQKVESGRLIGPRFFTTGPILNQVGGRNSNILQTLVDGPDEARSEVRKQFKDGYREIKVYSNLSDEAYAAILDEAKLLGMAVTGHPVEGMPPPEAPYDKPLPFDEVLDDGLSTLEHMESIIWHALDDETNEAAARGLARRIFDAGVVVSPTLIVHDNLTMQVETRGDHLRREEMERFSPLVKLIEAGNFDFWAHYEGEERARLNNFYQKTTGIFHEEGVTLVAGSDAGVMMTLPGSSIARELELLEESGLSPYEALECATINPAIVLGLENDIGQIRPGFKADLILVAGNPLKDIGTVEHPKGVMREGVWFDEEGVQELHEAAFEVSLMRSLRHTLMLLITK